MTPILTSMLCCVLALGAAAEPRALRIVVSLPPQVWLVESIGGPRVSVAALVGPGDGEETYSPTDAQVSSTLRADAFFRIGASFEQAPWFRALEATGKPEIVDARDGIELLRANGGAPDPHLWTSPRRLSIQARTIAAALSRLDPAHTDLYQRGRRDVDRELELLDRDLASTLGPFRGRSFFVFHPTWGYLANDYGLRQVSIEVDGKDPSDRDLTRLHLLAREEHPRSLFIDAQVSVRVAKSVASALGASVDRLDPLASDVPANLRRVARRLAESLAR